VVGLDDSVTIASHGGVLGVRRARAGLGCARAPCCLRPGASSQAGRNVRGAEAGTSWACGERAATRPRRAGARLAGEVGRGCYVGAAATGNKAGEEREGNFSPTLTELRRRHSAGEEGERGRGASSPRRSTARRCAREFGDGGAPGGARLRWRRWRGGKRSRGEELGEKLGEVRERGGFGGVMGKKTTQSRLRRCTVGDS
jgi:hypothetical protein